MKNQSRRERQRDSFRADILQAARSIVLSQGYAALTMRRIAEAVECSPAALYQYFKGRDEIARALSLSGFEELLRQLSGGRGFRDLARLYVEFGLKNPETYRIMFMDDPQITTAVLAGDGKGDPGRGCYDALQKSVAELRPGLPEVELQSWTDVLWSSLHGVVALRLTCPAFPLTPTDVLLERVCQMALGGLGVSGRGGADLVS